MSRQTELDDAGLLQLLWNPQQSSSAPKPGPKSSLTLEMVVTAGIAIADDRSGPVLSMRAVADRLGCTPMAIYSYVDNKQTLLRLMYDKAHHEFSVDITGDSAHENVHAWAIALAELYARHHWLTEVSWSRPVLGPHEQGVLEELLRQLHNLELPGIQQGTVASALFALCRNTGRLIADAHHAWQVSAVTDEQWWASQSAAMAEAAPDFAQRFPLSAGTTLRDADSGGAQAKGARDGAQGYLERAARSQLENSVKLLLAGATATVDPQE